MYVHFGDITIFFFRIQSMYRFYYYYLIVRFIYNDNTFPFTRTNYPGKIKLAVYAYIYT